MSIQEEIEQAIKDNELYALGELPLVDWEQAFKFYLPLAKAGDAKAQFNVAYCYDRGAFMDQDNIQAFEWYMKSVAQRDPRAHYNLSLMYERGDFVIQDVKKAKELFNRAIELGDERPSNLRKLSSNRKVLEAVGALKVGDRERARGIYLTVENRNREIELGIIACDVSFKSVYSLSANYSYHSSGSEKSRKFWKIADSLNTNTDVTMTNNSDHNWAVLVKALCRTSDGSFIDPGIAGALRAKEVKSNIINLKDCGDAVIFGVEIFEDIEGSADKPSYKYFFPDIPLKPDEKEELKLVSQAKRAEEAMRSHNKNAKPGACFILTACYGSYDAPTVLAFRQFRDIHLSKSKLGRNFISWYYRHGAKWAAAIVDKPRVKAVLRAVFNLLAKTLPR